MGGQTDRWTLDSPSDRQPDEWIATWMDSHTKDSHMDGLTDEWITSLNDIQPDGQASI